MLSKRNQTQKFILHDFIFMKCSKIGKFIDRKIHQLFPGTGRKRALEVTTKRCGISFLVQWKCSGTKQWG